MGPLLFLLARMGKINRCRTWKKNIYFSRTIDILSSLWHFFLLANQLCACVMHPAAVVIFFGAVLSSLLINYHSGISLNCSNILCYRRLHASMHQSFVGKKDVHGQYTSSSEDNSVLCIVIDKKSWILLTSYFHLELCTQAINSWTWASPRSKY